MFSQCYALTSLPSFNLSKIEDCRDYAWRCYNVQSGILASYKQLSGRGMTPAQHNQTFYNCGVSSRTGSAELAQIPSDWK